MSSLLAEKGICVMFRKCDLAPQLSPEGARTLNGYYGGVESLIHLTTCLRRHHWPLTSIQYLMTDFVLYHPTMALL